ncbi:calcium-binding protein [Roseobacter ponti]|uniref:Type I secretion target repeat protein n=1 Tax=Roseobacter ponti TaxID=1891787 RepID=A0A858SWK0_9RHOB|nr:hypothetical protein [Roseobacter ponti]QJF51841.1 hypothetical protein G3256_12040 [Roseobacter ponti]
MAKGGKKGGSNSGGGGSEGGSIKGNRKDNLLTGTEFDDTILARQGDDTLIGLGGNDFLFAEEGDDLLEGGSGNDRLFGMSGKDILNGGADHDELFGGADDDDLNGDGGDDVLLGGPGSDSISGGSGYDTAEFTDIGGDIPLSSDPGVTTVDGITLTSTGPASYTSVNRITPDTSETDTLTDIDRVIGSNFNDAMTGGDGADNFAGAYGDDVLIGGDGADVLYGGRDNDILEGGQDGDTFVFLRVADGILEPDPPVQGDTSVYDDPGTGDGQDVIVDFDLNEDQIVFLSNEDMTVGSYSDADGFTVLTYAAPDFQGPSEITLTGVTESADDLLAIGAIDILVDPGFDFIV